MELIDKRKMLDELTETVSLQLHEVRECYKDLPGELLNKPAVNGGWSIAQCLQHLNTYAAWYQPLISQSLEKAQPALIAPLYEPGFLGKRFIRMMDPETGKGKYKAAKKHRPGDISDAPQVVASFIRNQQTLLELLRLARNKDIGRVDIPVSVMPWLKLKTGDALRFLVAHNARHLVQAKKNYLYHLIQAES